MIKASKSPIQSRVSENVRCSTLIAEVEKLSNLQEHEFFKEAGFAPYVKESNIRGAGMGLFIKGAAKSGSVLAIYPGTVYGPGDSLFLSSIRNHYILKCFDGYAIDAKPTGLSKFMFLSHYKRLNYDPSYKIGTKDWIKDHNLSVGLGHYINDGYDLGMDNARYQELWLPPNFNGTLFNLHSNMIWHPATDETRCVCIIATRNIENEEILVRYNERVT
jgi:hypothetical protein